MATKKILISGTSSGFGKLTAQALAKEGHHVFRFHAGCGGQKQG
jgi:NADP-dependent 3-hydroxy acid dehydrogenase YdfG